MNNGFAVYTGKKPKDAIWFCGWAQGDFAVSSQADDAHVFPNRWIAEDTARVLGKRTKKEWKVKEIEQIGGDTHD